MAGVDAKAPTPTIRKTLREARAELAPISDEDRLESELLMAHALGTDRTHLLARLGEPLPAAASKRFRKLVDRRLEREPTAYILGHKEFFELDFEVTKAALIPRPESEALVELTLMFAKEHPGPLTVADVGTGCGAIGLSIAHALPAARVILTDTSKRALKLARRNAERFGLTDRVDLRQGSLLEPIPEPVDVIVANLPYVPTEEWRALPPELGQHEPKMAFDGGADGLRLIRRFLADAPSRLRPGGALFEEIADDQAEAVLALVERYFPEAASEARKDLANLDRIVCIYT